jgi:hypothetical protein
VTNFRPDFAEMIVFIKERVAVLRVPSRQWADLARLAVQGRPYNAQRLAELEAFINTVRGELRAAVIVASEHFTEEQLELLRKRANMSKTAWRSYKKSQPVNLKTGFTLVTY